MSRQGFVILLAFVAQACTTVRAQGMLTDADGNETGRYDIQSTSTSQGAAEVLAAIRSFKTEQAVTDVAAESVAQGMPTDLTTETAQVHSAGMYGYGMYGSGLYGQPIDAALLATEAATLRVGPFASPYGLPRLQHPPQRMAPGYPTSTGVQPSGTLPSLIGNGKVPCPKDREPSTAGERISCLEHNQRQIVRDVFKR